MLYIKNRQKQIINNLLYDQKVYKIEELLKTYGVSERTLMNDLDSIEIWALSMGLTLNRNYRDGISLSFNTKKARASKVEFLLNKQERIALIILFLLSTGKPITISVLSNKLNVSYATILEDINDAEKLVEDLNLKLIRKQNYGIDIAGDEKDIRNASFKIILKSINIKYLFHILYHRNNKNYKKSFYFIESVFPYEMLSAVYDMAVSILKKYRYRLSDYSTIEFVIKVTIAINRIQHGKEVAPLTTSEGDGCKEQKDDKEYLMINELKSAIRKYFNINLNKAEVSELTIILSGTSDLKLYDSQAIDSNVGYDTIKITKELFDKFYAFYGVDFSSDIDLFIRLASHLKKTIYAINSKQLIFNPLLEDIKHKYPYMFQFVSVLCKQIKYNNEKIIFQNEAEIAYITLYFQMALEKHSQKQIKYPKVLLISGYSKSIVSYLKNKIEGIFSEITIEGTYAWSQINSKFIKDNEIDLLISTESFAYPGVNVCVINPLLTMKDVELISQNLVQIAQKKAGYSEEARELMLKEVLTEENVQINAEVDDWEEAIRLGGNLLMKSGGIGSSYIDKMVNIVKDIGPYIVIAPGIALAHARPEDGAKSTCFSLITLKNPVEFGHPENDPVNILITFASIDSSSHLNALGEILEIISKKDYVDRLINAKSVQEVYEVVNAAL